MSTTHTPGPWHIGGRTIFRPTFTIFNKPFGLGDIAEVHEEGNANLIALAPEMYEYIALAASNGCAKAQQLIAKAKGI